MHEIDKQQRIKEKRIKLDKRLLEMQTNRIYMEAIKSGKDVRRYVRINVIGENGAGKSSLIRRLLGQDIDDVKRTDGIDKINNIQIRTSDGEWIVNKDVTDMKSADFVECGLWNFAGHTDYYAIHQNFLTPHVIYLLVSDISKDSTLIYYDHDDEGFDSIGNHVDFWFDSIHSLCRDFTGYKLNPPIINICTHSDKYESSEKLKARECEYKDNFDRNIRFHKKGGHMRRDLHFISNTKSDERDIQALKEDISKLADSMDYFAVALPTKWIQLDVKLSNLKDSNTNILSFEEIWIRAQEMLTDEKELHSFLNYQHSIGDIIFFEDIRDYINLNPNWLVKCFGCLVFNERYNKRSDDISSPTERYLMKNTGEVSDEIIDLMFEKDPDIAHGQYKTYILAVMERFGMIVKLQRKVSDNDGCQIINSYFMPSLIRKQQVSVKTNKKYVERFLVLLRLG
ncbi:leucine-rich repeat serine/threonine-protein kinase 2-like isoform X1 [Mytilus californianus]|uniref:leucine-rich repeat serine/threonine-protein kinase 2-like isoform X1 n=1 Tax=Mytilus californianus TaxID=6549 RepID=UPI0022475F63|nr:leucine-rich repeat serine/threonine-protein kinase 2-like isoform X1 [Mytilus californianus]